MSAALGDRLRRRVLPRAVVALSQVDRPARWAAAARRRLGRRERLELFFAFDDAASAVAVLELVRRTAGRDVRLLPRPVVRRGIPGDPAVDAKRRYAVVDAARVGRRSGLVLRRNRPLAPEDTAFLAEWVAAVPPGPPVTRFCAEALEALWVEDEAPSRERLAARWRALTGREPVAAPDAVRRLERRMRRRGPYDTPAACRGREWWFAQDRLDQIEARLDVLGWRRAA